MQPLHRRRKEIADAQRVQDDGERIYRLADGPENRADHESNEQVNTLIAEENGQRFGVNGHVDGNFRFGSLACAEYASPALDTTNWPPKLARARSARFRRLAFAHPIASQPILCSLTWEFNPELQTGSNRGWIFATLERPRHPHPEAS